DAQREQDKQDDQRSERPWYVVPFEPGDCGRGDGCDHAAADHGHDDRRGDAQRPRQADGEQCHSDEKPGGHSEVPEPAWRREHRRHPLELLGVEWHHHLPVDCAGSLERRRRGRRCFVMASQEAREFHLPPRSDVCERAAWFTANARESCKWTSTCSRLALWPALARSLIFA